MSVDVFVYDSGCLTLRQPFSVSTIDRYGAVLDTSTCARKGPEWGATLATGGASPDVYGILIDDAAGSHSPFIATDLNGVPGGRIDAVMILLPTAGGASTGPAPTKFGDIERYVASQERWEDTEKSAVRRLTAAYILGSRFRDADDSWKEWLDQWGDRLRARQIKPELLATVVQFMTA
jgi:hypothetical protein